MDRKNRKRVTYVSGANATLGNYGMREQKKKKKRGGFHRTLRIALLVIAATALIAVVLAVSLSNVGRTEVGRATRIGATLSQNVTPFGDKVIFYDGTTLHCVAATGGNEWSYQIGNDANYDATENRIVAWTGNDIYILNTNGRLVYNDKMSDEIQFASAGDNYVAVFIGDPDNGVIRIIEQSGQIIDNIIISNQTLLDIGFFYSTTSSSAQAAELMWVLGLDTTGTVISTELQTFQPGKLSTGKSSLGEHIAYMVYGHNEMLNIVDTREIKHYNYRALEAAASTLIYGYAMADTKTVGKTMYQLLIPEQEQNQGMVISNLRLMYGNVDRMLHLPGVCMDAKLGTHSVYGFSSNAVYVCRYGETAFSAYSLPVHITSVLGMISDNRVIAASGSEIYVIELPT
ncbi:MAG: hypothetical protein IKU34_02785 [Clostridia bacterium]|nr:hypothetical protein [Clostridia bacterium]